MSAIGAALHELLDALTEWYDAHPPRADDDEPTIRLRRLGYRVIAECWDDDVDRLAAIEIASHAYVASDPPRPEWKALCDALGVDWHQG